MGMDWLVWLGLGALLIVAELFSLDLILLMLAGGALAGAVTAGFVDNIVIEAVVAMVVAFALLGVVRPGLLGRLHGGPELVLGTRKLIGLRAVAPGTISTHQPGQIKIDGELWTAQPYDEHLVIEPGTTVEVLEIRGATAYVHPVPELEL
ncbi:NfeD family protein [Nocardioides sp. KR10-350]|uniref:NfeD family protein n=1 Tax=Nocardioides cheoyonin TaxID=3156615 RepID=UPI0032B3C9A5